MWMWGNAIRSECADDNLYVHMYACMWMYVRAAVSGQVHLVWARGQTRTHRANHMEDVERGDVQPLLSTLAVCHDRRVTRDSQLSQRWGGGRRQGGPQQLLHDRKGEISARLEFASSLFCTRALKTCQVVDLWRGTKRFEKKKPNIIIKGPFQAFQNPRSGFQADLLFRYSGGRHSPRVPQQSVPCDALV